MVGNPRRDRDVKPYFYDFFQINFQVTWVTIANPVTRVTMETRQSWAAHALLVPVVAAPVM